MLYLSKKKKQVKTGVLRLLKKYIVSTTVPGPRTHCCLIFFSESQTAAQTVLILFHAKKKKDQIRVFV